MLWNLSGSDMFESLSTESSNLGKMARPGTVCSSRKNISIPDWKMMGKVKWNARNRDQPLWILLKFGELKTPASW